MRRVWLLGACSALFVGACGGGGYTGGTLVFYNLQVLASGTQGVFVQVSPSDANGRTGGTCPVTFRWVSGTTVQVVAPSTWGSNSFAGWYNYDGSFLWAQPTITFDMLGNYQITASYTSGGGGGGSGCSFTPNYVNDLERLLKWPSVPIKLYISQGGAWTQERENAAISGIVTWLQNVQAPFNIVRVWSPDQANITFEFIHSFGDNKIGLATYSYSGSNLVSAHVQVETYRESLNDIAQISAHEVGHACGIGGHSSVQGDLMYATFALGSSWTLTTRDANTMQTAYCYLYTSGPEWPLPTPHGPIQTVTIECPGR